ncbi:hypothetical protein [Thalassotalea marina]|uniref:Uncharacterized protein n=1 Tax=Thalassotalea marina TaxID=1673741 RepID=A0A919BD20_9GAMM|nr:hypothetical protein [Thalassotalea marina]GHF82460.1 hypothetical protein GCM10017161_07040 [Thalassotalea marina]
MEGFDNDSNLLQAWIKKLGSKRSNPLRFAISYTPRTHLTKSKKVYETFEVVSYSKGVLIKVKRPQDFTDLTIVALGFELGSKQGDFFKRKGPFLFRKKGAGQDNLSIAFIFPPQIVMEQVFKEEPSQIKEPVDVRLSGKSQIVIKPDYKESKRIVIKVDEFFQMLSTGDLQIDKRARASLLNSWKDQLSSTFGSEAGPSDKDKWRELLNKAMQPPDSDVSQFEVIPRIIMSASDETKWRPSSPVAGKGTGKLSNEQPIFSVSFDRQGRESVRALWSKHLETGKLPSHDISNPPPDTIDYFDTVVEQKYHWDIVGRTSLYGLIALRPADDKKFEQNETEEARLSHIDIANPRIIRPKLTKDETVEIIDLIEKETGLSGELGLLQADPFKSFNLLLSSYGSTHKASWAVLPPSIYPEDLTQGFSLQSFDSKYTMGHLHKLVTVETGYLLPLGVSATLVSVTERSITKGPQGEKDGVSFIHQYKFIVCDTAWKAYPAVYQPYEGRGFPAESVQMLTKKTPRINQKHKEACIGNGIPVSEAFWVILDDKANNTTDKPFVFSWRTKDAPKITSELMFLSYSAIDKPAIMGRVKKAYNDTNIEKRTASLAGVRHQYAESKTLGDTSFNTVSWLMATQGRLGIDNGSDEEHFNRDGRMVAAKQIPIYPRLEKADIRLQTIAAISGESSKVSHVVYHEHYVKHGFETNAKTAVEKTVSPEIFLRVKDKNSILDINSKSNTVGGFAGPQVNVGAISRSRGLIGGTNATSLAKNSGSFDVTKALSGNYSPTEFLPNGLVLGIDLNSLIQEVDSNFKNAPELRETVEYGVREAFDTVQDIAESLYELLYGSDKLVEKTKKFIKRFDDTTGRPENFMHYYPRLFNALQPLISDQAAVKKDLNAIINAQNPSGIMKPINDLYEYLNKLSKAIDRFVNDPIPDAIDQIIEQYKNWLKFFNGNLDSILKRALHLVVKEVTSYLVNGFTTAIDEQGYGEALFGPLGLTDSDFLNNPQQALRAMQDGVLNYGTEKIWTLFETVFALLDGVSWPKAINIEKVKKRIELAAHRAVDIYQDSLKDAAESIRDKDFVQKKINQYLDSLVKLWAGKLQAIVTGEKGQLDKVLCQLFELVNNLPQDIETEKAKFSQFIKNATVLENGVPSSIKDEVMIIVDKELDALVEKLTEEIELIKAKLAPAVEVAKKGQFELGYWLIKQSLVVVPDLFGLPLIARKPEDACRELASYLRLLASELLPSEQDLELSFNQLKQQVINWTPNNDFVKRIKDRILSDMDDIENRTLAALNNTRKQLNSTDICGEPGKALGLLIRITGLRGDLLNILLVIGERLDDVYQANTSIHADFEDIIPVIAQFMFQIAAADVKKDQIVKLNQSVAILKSLGVEADELEGLLEDFKDHQQQAESSLSTIQPGKLHQFVKQQLVPYREILEGKLASILMSPLAYGEKLVQYLNEPARKQSKILLGNLTIGLNKVEELIQTFEDAIKQTPIGVFFKSLLADLEPGRVKINDEIKTANELIDRLRNNPNSTPVLIEVWKVIEQELLIPYSQLQGGLLLILTSLKGIKLKEVFEDVIGQFIEPLRNIEEQATLMLEQMVPSRFTTTYKSQFELKSYPNDRTPVFEMAKKGSKAVPDLSLNASFMVDPIKGETEASIRGILQPFKIHIPPSPRGCTINFKKSIFKSSNGESPKLTMEIDNVEIHGALQFLNALAPYFGNKGNGAYINLTSNKVSAGVRYTAGLIQMGTFQILNVNFDIGAHLPFSGDKAIAYLNLANKDRPFLISSPPYAGGGWLNIERPFGEGEVGSLISVGLVFGGQVYMRYGPLSAQAYAFVGIWYLKIEKNWTLTGLFEAGAHGKVAFFSISVFIRMTLSQTSQGDMNGEVKMVFKFKVGFAKFRYKVTARKNFKGKNQENAAIGINFDDGELIKVTTKVPNKRTQWKKYSSHFAE